MRVVVVGRVARDLVLTVPSVPGPGGTTPVQHRDELLGGKGANQAVALAQLGHAVALVGVVGDDGPGTTVLEQARADGIDVEHVVTRPGARTALLVDVTDGSGDRRVLEDVPPEVLLREADVLAAADLLRDADVLVLQLQEPASALLRAVGLAGTVTVVLDGAPGERVDELLRAADVLRADAAEAELLAGHPLPHDDDVLQTAVALHRRGPSVVALGTARAGTALAWDGGSELLPPLDVPVADPTGGGDAFVAGLVSALLGGTDPRQAAHVARATAASSVQRTGGRPGLSVAGAGGGGAGEPSPDAQQP